MKNIDISNYPNFLEQLTLNANDVCEIIKDYKLSFSQTRNNNVEWGIKFPMFLTPFYKYVSLNNFILNQPNFWEYYISENASYFDDKKFSNEIIDGLKARVFRTYPSLVRDLHFSLFVKENVTDAIVIYNQKLDIEEGVDLLISNQKRFYAFNMYTNTSRAYVGREKKANRHTPFDNVQYVELPVNFKGSVKCGEFFLYGATEFTQITKILKQIWIKENMMSE